MINRCATGVVILGLVSLTLCAATQSPVMINTTFGPLTGFNCTNNTCKYICFGPYCSDYTKPKEGIKKFLQCGMQCGWGIGAAGRDGCDGSNCGYWNGCKGTKCEGFYDFRKCGDPFCTSGPFQGYFCRGRQCPIVCRGNVCHSRKYYGKQRKCSTNCRTGPFTN